MLYGDLLKSIFTHIMDVCWIRQDTVICRDEQFKGWHA